MHVELRRAMSVAGMLIVTGLGVLFMAMVVMTVLIVTMLGFGMLFMTMVVVIMRRVIVAGMIVMAVVIMTIFGVGMLLMPVVIMPMPVIMVMRVPDAAFARLTQGEPVGRGQFDDRRLVRDLGQRVDEKGFETRPDPEHDIGVFEIAGVRWPQRIIVRRCRTVDQKDRRVDALHDAGDQRMDRLDGRDDATVRRLSARRRDRHQRERRDAGHESRAS